MKERPVLFPASMVCTILEGKLRQIVHVMEGGPNHMHHGRLLGAWSLSSYRRCAHGVLTFELQTDVDDSREFKFPCPYGKPGDRLWVREKWALEACGTDGDRIIWAADRAAAWLGNLSDIFWLSSDYQPKRWRPGFMPRWASRILLDIQQVKVKRLRDVGAEDPTGMNPWAWVVSVKRAESP